jgi:transposase
MIKLEFTEKEKVALNYERYHYPHPKVQRKIEALWLKSQGEQNTRIAQLTGVTKNMVTRYIKEYQAGGLEGLKQLHYCRSHGALDQHRHSIEQDFQQRPPATLKEAMGRIEALTGLKRSTVQIGKFLKRVGLSRHKMGMVPAKADLPRQEEFKKNSSPDWMRPRRGNGRCFLSMARILCWLRFWVTFGPLVGYS